MKIILFTFYYPPDLSAGSFRSVALVKALSKNLKSGDELHVITTHPNRYSSYKESARDIEHDSKITIHRITVPDHQASLFFQIRKFVSYSISSYKICKQIGPVFIIGTTSRLMTGILTGVFAYRLKCRYFIDVRDIFSETISEIISLKSKILGKVSKTIFFYFEKILLNNASGVNVVSEGFLEYFIEGGVDVSNWSFFPNGVDKEFQNLRPTRQKNIPNDITTILYAGNIGSGQGIDNLLPEVAKKLGNRYKFLILGDGGMRGILAKNISKKGIDNIEILPPVRRNKLIEHYQNADILFLHLNDISAFLRVLPSKIFEYVATGRPIVAGISGYSAKFLKSNVSHALIFQPGDVNQCIESIRDVESLRIDNNQIDIFINEYARAKIMKEMASHIYKLL